jgi:hypothetical protein
VAVTFGIISALGLLAGPIGDQSFWQRVFSMRKQSVVPAFMLAALFFGLVPFLMSLLGFLAAGLDFAPDQVGYVNLEIIVSAVPRLGAAILLVVLLSGLMSTVDSQLVAFGSLMMDWSKPLEWQRFSMVLAGLIGLGIAVIPGITVTAMFLIYGTLRTSPFLITVLTFLGVTLHPKGALYGILLGLSLGVPS